MDIIITYDFKKDISENTHISDSIKRAYAWRVFMYLEENGELLQNEYYVNLRKRALNFVVDLQLKHNNDIDREELMSFYTLYAKLENRKRRDGFQLTPEIEKYISEL